jgi:hypothetical protein
MLCVGMNRVLSNFFPNTEQERYIKKTKLFERIRFAFVMLCVPTQRTGTRKNYKLSLSA